MFISWNYREILAHVGNKGSTLRFVSKQTLELCKAAVKNDPKALFYAKIQTEEMCIDALERCELCDCSNIFKWVINKTPKICNLAISRDPLYSLQYIDNQTRDLCMLAVKNQGLALRFVRDKTEELCLAAVKSDGRAIEFVNNKTYKIFVAAVKSNGRALEFVDNKTKKLCIYALINNKNCYKFLPKYYQKYGKTYMYKWAKSQIAFEKGNGLNIYNNDFDIKFSYGH